MGVFNRVTTGFISFIAVTLLFNALGATATADDRPSLAIERHLTLAPVPGNPRNSEGDFLKLKDGRWLFVYTHFTAGAGDHATAHLASRESSDGGRTWSAEDKVVVPNEGGFNVMSVTLHRLPSGEIALIYLRKNSLEDCRPVIRFSSDETKTWSAPIECITDDIGYYVLNNDRVIQLKNGRLVMPTALHRFNKGKLLEGEIVTFFSDDKGRTWKRSESILKTDEHNNRISFMEPGVVEVKKKQLLMIIRTKLGCQYLSESKDHGETWSTPKPTGILSPEAPATLTRIPRTGDLLLVWNDHAGQAEDYRRKQPPIRTPLVAAISRDGGRTWEKKKRIEDQPNHGYCYTAVAFEDSRILLGYCAHKSPWGLETTRITSFQCRDLYR